MKIMFTLLTFFFLFNAFSMTVKEATIIVGKYGLVPDHPDYISKENKDQLMEAIKLLKEKKINHKAFNMLTPNMCCNWAIFGGQRVGRCEQFKPGSDCSDFGAGPVTVCYASSTRCTWSKAN